MSHIDSTVFRLEPHGPLHTVDTTDRSAFNARTSHRDKRPGDAPPDATDTKAPFPDIGAGPVNPVADEQILPFDNLLRIALLASIGLLTAICWALLLWGVGTLIQLSVEHAPHSAATLISERTLWITAVVWPIAFLALAMVCVSTDRHVAAQDTVEMNKQRNRTNS